MNLNDKKELIALNTYKKNNSYWITKSADKIPNDFIKYLDIYKDSDGNIVSHLLDFNSIELSIACERTQVFASKTSINGNAALNKYKTNEHKLNNFKKNYGLDGLISDVNLNTEKTLTELRVNIINAIKSKNKKLLSKRSELKEYSKIFLIIECIDKLNVVKVNGQYIDYIIPPEEHDKEVEPYIPFYDGYLMKKLDDEVKDLLFDGIVFIYKDDKYNYIIETKYINYIEYKYNTEKLLHTSYVERKFTLANGIPEILKKGYIYNKNRDSQKLTYEYVLWSSIMYH